MNAKLICLLIWLPLASIAQGFAGLGDSAEGFSIPTPNPTFSFPADVSEPEVLGLDMAPSRIVKPP